jgi:hypothetical protein
MGFNLFPDPPVAPLLVGSNARLDSVFTQHAGTPLPELAGVYAQMMFVRVAMIGGTLAPSFFVTAGVGPSVLVTTDPTPVYRETAVGGAGTGFVGDAFLIEESANVFQILVGLDQSTAETWKLGIRNNDPAADRLYTWVAADSAAETVQPWVNPVTFAPAFAEAISEQFVPVSAEVGAPVTLSGKNFHIGTPRVSFGATAANLLTAPAPTSLKVAVPAGLSPETDMAITVTTDAGTTTSALKFRSLSRHVVLLGHPDHGIETIAQKLGAAGFPKVTVGPESFTDTTELVVSVVSCVDGPMPGTRTSILALAGRVLQRVAIVMTKVDQVDDAEIRALVELETRELLARCGITPLDPGQVVKSPLQDVGVEIDRILLTPKRNYLVVAP